MKLLFIIGRNRSGTKWLSNILAENREVSSVRREGAGGILESNELSHFPKNFNLDNIEDRTAFEILFKYSNFHKCSNITDEKLKEIDYKDFHDFFCKYAKAIADNEKKAFFLQKASSNYLPVLLKRFPDAKFIIIQRTNIVENVVSSILLSGKREIVLKDIIIALLGYWRYRKLENKYLDRDNVLKVTYEDLKSSTEKVVSEACKFTGLVYGPEMLTLRYKPNSSYRNEKEREKYISPSAKFFVKIFSAFLSVLPLSFFQMLINSGLLSNNSRSLFISKTFELYRNS